LSTQADSWPGKARVLSISEVRVRQVSRRALAPGFSRMNRGFWENQKKQERQDLRLAGRHPASTGRNRSAVKRPEGRHPVSHEGSESSLPAGRLSGADLFRYRIGWVGRSMRPLLTSGRTSGALASALSKLNFRISRGAPGGGLFRGKPGASALRLRRCKTITCRFCGSAAGRWPAVLVLQPWASARRPMSDFGNLLFNSAKFPSANFLRPIDRTRTFDMDRTRVLCQS